MSQIQEPEVLREWRQSASYWQKHIGTIRTMFSPVTRALIEDAGLLEGDAVLDVAGGPGEPSLTIAEAVGPTGSVTCTDAVAEMVSAAQSEALRRGVRNVTFVSARLTLCHSERRHRVFPQVFHFPSSSILSRTRNAVILRIRGSGSGWSSGNWIDELAEENFERSLAKALTADGVG